ncbi:Protein smg7 [Tyrophagus putrescentiae]|nr:Protein smg7 [Tyrophagus putrescentiae]
MRPRRDLVSRTTNTTTNNTPTPTHSQRQQQQQPQQTNGQLNAKNSNTGSSSDEAAKNKKEEDAFHFESLVSLEKECQKALSTVLLNPLAAEAVTAEQQLWSSFIRKYKVHMNSYMINYLLGFYETLMQTLYFSTPRTDGSSLLQFHRSSFDVSQTNQELLYLIHIRIGDLYRYIDARPNAKVYYQRALQVDPRRGTAYNQIALCTPLTKPYKLLYFSALASNCSVEPVKSAVGNFKKAIGRLNNRLFEQLRKEMGLPANEAAIDAAEPETGAEWFYLSVVCVHLNNFNYSFGALLDWTLELLGKDEEEGGGIDLDYSLMAIDVALDWIMKNRDTDKTKKIGTIEQTLRQLGAQFKDALALEEDSAERTQKQVVSQVIALKHNFILQDFAPLKDVYESMYFVEEMRRYVARRDRKILTTRLLQKLGNF